MSKEIYKTVSGYSNYEVSNFGNVKNKITNKLLKPCLKSGYLCLSLTDNDGERKFFKIHRLVALTFIPNPDNKKTVNHKDHNKTNNKLDNLEWATTAEQNNHRRKCDKKIRELVSSRAVWQINYTTNKKIQLFQTIKFASEWVFNNNLTSVTDFNDGNNIKTKICAVARGKRLSAFGYKWQYDNSDEKKYDDEEWKDIPSHFIDGTKGYKISNYGRVKNSKGRITEGYNHESGYLWVSAPKQHLLHRLVAKVFIPNPDNKEQVNHIDGNKKNVHVNNLEWVTNKENAQHAHDNSLQPKTKKIIQYDLSMNQINIFNSQRDASRKLNISKDMIKYSIDKEKTTCGFIFKVVN